MIEAGGGPRLGAAGGGPCLWRARDPRPNAPRAAASCEHLAVCTVPVRLVSGFSPLPLCTRNPPAGPPLRCSNRARGRALFPTPRQLLRGDHATLTLTPDRPFPAPEHCTPGSGGVPLATNLCDEVLIIPDRSEILRCPHCTHLPDAHSVLATICTSLPCKAYHCRTRTRAWRPAAPRSGVGRPTPVTGHGHASCCQAGRYRVRKGVCKDSSQTQGSWPSDLGWGPVIGKSVAPRPGRGPRQSGKPLLPAPNSQVLDTFSALALAAAAIQVCSRWRGQEIARACVGGSCRVTPALLRSAPCSLFMRCLWGPSPSMPFWPDSSAALEPSC